MTEIKTGGNPAGNLPEPPQDPENSSDEYGSMISIKSAHLDSTLDWGDNKAIEKRIARQNEFWKLKRAGARNGESVSRGPSQDTIKSLGEYFGGIMIDELDENRVPDPKLLELFRDCFG